MELRAARLLDCLASEQARKREWELCQKDILHWLRYWCWVHEPRNAEDMQILPFIPWDYQEAEIRTMEQIIEESSGAYSAKRSNVIREKSRDMADSWTMISIAEHRWQFRKASILIGSRKEEEVDKLGDMDTPFEKIRFQLLRQPEFLIPEGFNWRKHSKHMHLINPQGGEIVGESANANFGRGGRKLFIWFDEFPTWEHDYAAWRSCSQTTNLKIATGTPNGPHNKFARLRHGEEREEVIIRTMPWWIHPIKSQGLELINGKYTSPWYREQQRTMSPEDLAREVDISYASSIKGWVFDCYGYSHRQYDLKPVSEKPIIVAWDPGVYFGVLIGQIDHYGRALFFKEMLFENAQLKDVATEVKAYLYNKFSGYAFKHVGDPAGAVRSHSNQIMPEYSELQMHHGITVQWTFMARIAPKSRVKTRVAGLKNKMKEFIGATNGPGLILDPEGCPYLDKAFAGEYRRRVTQEGQILEDIEEVHPSEDVVDCAGFIVLSEFPMGFDLYKKEKRYDQAHWGRPSGRR